VRIVSLLPSATEIVFALGLGRKLVGVSHECDWPPDAGTRRVVTRPSRRVAGRSGRTIHRLAKEAVHGGSSLYDLDEAALAELRPDIILTQELCEVCAPSYERVNEVARRLSGDVTVVSLEPSSVEGIFHSISTVGAMTGAESAAMRVVERLRGRLGRIERRVEKRRGSGHRPPRVVALEWLDPPFAAGHWVPEQVRRAGGWEVLGHEGERSTETTWRAVREVDPEMLLLMPCGYHVNEARAEWQRTRRPPYWSRLEAVRRAQVFVVDGSAYFSRPGPRVLDGIAMLAEIFDPEGFVDTAPVASWTPVD
jgi:iron complex transport system substrate-binding protein